MNTGNVACGCALVVAMILAPLSASAQTPSPGRDYGFAPAERPGVPCLQCNQGTYFQRHPKVKSATKGAAIGAGAGALGGLITGHGLMHGALVGGGTGAGVGLVRSSETLSRHPIFRDVATGGLIGAGTSGVLHRHGHLVEGAGIGAALGLGWGVLKHGFH